MQLHWKLFISPPEAITRPSACTAAAHANKGCCLCSLPRGAICYRRGSTDGGGIASLGNVTGHRTSAFRQQNIITRTHLNCCEGPSVFRALSSSKRLVMSQSWPGGLLGTRAGPSLNLNKEDEVKRRGVTGNQQDGAKRLYITFSLVPSLSSFPPSSPWISLCASLPRHPCVLFLFQRSRFSDASSDQQPLVQETADPRRRLSYLLVCLYAPRWHSL